MAKNDSAKNLQEAQSRFKGKPDMSKMPPDVRAHFQAVYTKKTSDRPK